MPNGWRGRQEVKTLFFTWQNLYRQYPPPFRWLEQWVLKTADYALMGNQAAVSVFQQKGYAGPHQVIPQFGVAEGLFSPPEQRDTSGLKIGFAGRFVAEKGVDLLIRAVAQLGQEERPWSLHLAGKGPQEGYLKQLCQQLGIDSHVVWHGSLPSAEMPQFLQMIDVLVLPSRTQANWAEQFGRILVEAMACETVVVGSNSGEIPHVIGAAGLVFAEDDLGELVAHLRTLSQDTALCQEFGQRGRRRMLEQYTQQQIASQTAAVYREMMG